MASGAETGAKTHHSLYCEDHSDVYLSAFEWVMSVEELCIMAKILVYSEDGNGVIQVRAIRPQVPTPVFPQRRA